MRDNAELLAGPAAQCLRSLLMELIAGHKRIGREQLLGTVCEIYEHSLAELVSAGRVLVEVAPQDERHLDTLVAADIH